MIEQRVDASDPTASDWFWILAAWLTPFGLWGLMLLLQGLAALPDDQAVTEWHWQERSIDILMPFEASTIEFGSVQTLLAQVDTPSSDLYAVYIPSAESNFELRLDGLLVGSGGDFSERYRRVKHRPMWFPIAMDSEQAQRQLQLKIKSPSSSVAILGVYFGPASVLEPAYQWRYRYKVLGMQVVLICIAIAVLLVGSLWFSNRRDKALGWFVLGVLFWGLRNLDFIVLNQALGPAAWDIMSQVWFVGFLYCITLFGHHFANYRKPAVELGLLLLYALALFAMIELVVVFDWSVNRAANYALRPIILLNGIYLMVFYLRLALASDTAQAHWLNAANLTAFSFGIHDLLKELGLLGPASMGMLQYSSIMVLFAFGGVLLLRFNESRRLSENMYLKMDTEVRRARAELEQASARRSELERTATLARERERIMRDMHDGIGGQLVSVLSAVRGGAADTTVIESALEQALKDLRIIIDSLDEASEDLAVALGMFRNRIEPTVAASGIQLHWATADLPDDVNLGPERLLQVYRLLQEALQNAFKHAVASNVWISAEVMSDDSGRFIDLLVRDDGVGMPEQLVAGHGLRNMDERAIRAGGQLRIRDVKPGTEVRLRIPWRLPRDAEPRYPIDAEADSDEGV